MELEQKCTAKREVREKETEEKKMKKFTVEGLTEAIAPYKIGKRGPHAQKLFTNRSVHGTLSAYKQIYDDKGNKTRKPPRACF